MSEPVIRKIGVGPDMKDSIPYIVGNSIFRGALTITAIKKVAPRAYEVWCENSEGEKVLQKTIEHMPVVVDYNVDYE